MIETPLPSIIAMIKETGCGSKFGVRTNIKNLYSENWMSLFFAGKSIHVTKNTSSPPDVVTSYELEYCPGLSTISKRFFSGSKSPLTLHIGATAKLSCGLKPDGEHDVRLSTVS